MATPQLCSQLLKQLGQWIIPKDLRHLKNCAEIVESESACLAHWIPYLSHRDCQARSHMDGNHENWDKKNLVAIHESCHDYVHMNNRGKIVEIHAPC
jgi:5-methylcytosine-specific restriction endonuclease McrA